MSNKVTRDFLANWREQVEAGFAPISCHVVLLRIPESTVRLNRPVRSEESGVGSKELR